MDAKEASVLRAFNSLEVDRAGVLKAVQARGFPAHWGSFCFFSPNSLEVVRARVLQVAQARGGVGRSLFLTIVIS